MLLFLWVIGRLIADTKNLRKKCEGLLPLLTKNAPILI